MTKVAINGLGRIGRATMKILIDNPDLELVAVNDLIPAEGLAYLLEYDSVYGHYEKGVGTEGEDLRVEDKVYKVLHEKNPANLPWKDMGIDLVFECTGLFTKKEDLEKHLQAGANHVILSAPTKSSEIVSIVHGVNKPEGPAKAISCASCTTNCITPVVEIMRRNFGVKKAIMTTVHAYTSTQAIVDTYNKKLRRGRAGAVNLVPTTTGAAKATTKVIPELEGKFDGVAVRVPVPVGSIADMVFVVERSTNAEEVNEVFRKEASSERYKGVLGASDHELVSADIVGDSRASIVDLPMTQVVDGDLVKVMSWYDNEWGYAAQMVREAVEMARST
jgi:glyceraldehyde 3-phosphate dehydrogenase